MPPLPRDKGDKGANMEKLFFEDSFVNLTHFSVTDVHFSIKSININKINKIHAPKIQGRVFSEVAEAPQAAATQTHSSGSFETGKNVNY